MITLRWQRDPRPCCSVSHPTDPRSASGVGCRGASIQSTNAPAARPPTALHPAARSVSVSFAFQNNCCGDSMAASRILHNRPQGPAHSRQVPQTPVISKLMPAGQRAVCGWTWAAVSFLRAHQGDPDALGDVREHANAVNFSLNHPQWLGADSICRPGVSPRAPGQEGNDSLRKEDPLAAPCIPSRPASRPLGPQVVSRAATIHSGGPCSRAAGWSSQERAAGQEQVHPPWPTAHFGSGSEPGGASSTAYQQGAWCGQEQATKARRA